MAASPLRLATTADQPCPGEESLSLRRGSGGILPDAARSVQGGEGACLTAPAGRGGPASRALGPDRGWRGDGVPPRGAGRTATNVAAPRTSARSAASTLEGTSMPRVTVLFTAGPGFATVFPRGGVFGYAGPGWTVRQGGRDEDPLRGGGSWWFSRARIPTGSDEARTDSREHGERALCRKGCSAIS